MWIALPIVGLLIVLSIIGAFYGAEKAKLFFNSPPLVVFWSVLLILLLAGIVTSDHLRKNLPQFIMHLAGVLIIAGSMWGSEQGHLLCKRLFGAEKFASGYMLIAKGSTEKNITKEDFNQQLGQLPFGVKLNNFRIEYYPAKEADAPKTIQNYCSDVAIVENGKEILNKTIKVNQPLHYGGYYFYQNSYDAKMMTYSIFGVVPDNGLYAVYAGYWILGIGIFWHFWFKHIIKYIKGDKNGN
jgi:hypothetical protein